ncbi:hypothetical protein EVG20_g8734 [Dentipellis fragilis]|uniref:Peptidase A1 domain-containing protein n=1 Tax=Dentipellis fragilis TaxID=205917 RepID=A0A4Y9Y563_9AGAM|nr:hypothetical protein EVG20_g8734 [Dentipellis fragilis]
MQLYVSFKGLLAAVVVALFACDDAVAAPTAFPIISGQSNNSTIANRAPAPLRIPLTPVNEDLNYIASVAIGGNLQPFNLVMDSGSSDFWVYAAECPQRGTHNGVSSATSPEVRVDSTFRWTLQYTEGSRVSGIMAIDSVRLGDVSFPRYVFGIAGEAAGPITRGIEDGVLGFGPQRGSRIGTPNIAQVFAGNGHIPAPILGWSLSRARDGGHGGELSLGAPNQAKFKPATLTPPIPNVGGEHWGVTVTGTKINGLPIPTIGNRVAVLDTGSTEITMPLPDANAINQQLGAIFDAPTGKFYIPCNTNRQVSFTIANQDWVIDPRDLVATRFMRDGWCQSTIQRHSDGSWTLGTAFMKNVFLTSLTSRICTRRRHNTILYKDSHLAVDTAKASLRISGQSSPLQHISWNLRRWQDDRAASYGYEHCSFNPFAAPLRPVTGGLKQHFHYTITVCTPMTTIPITMLYQLLDAFIIGSQQTLSCVVLSPLALPC